VSCFSEACASLATLHDTLLKRSCEAVTILGCGNPLKCLKLGRLKRLAYSRETTEKKSSREFDFWGIFLRIFLSMRDFLHNFLVILLGFFIFLKKRLKIDKIG